MSEIGDAFKELKQIRREKKARNQESSTDVLIKEGIQFETRNYGNHLIVKGETDMIDFWPSTGKFIVRIGGRNCGKSGRGIRSLLKVLKAGENEQ